MNRADVSTEKLVLLILSRIPGLGPARINTIRRELGCSTDILRAGEADFGPLPGIGRVLARNISAFLHNSAHAALARKEAENQLSLLERHNTELVTLDDPSYPPLLREIHDPPPLLFVRGDIRAADAPCLSIVGTRGASQYGRKATDLFCRELVSNGVTIVSGLARGIDTAAHTSALENGGKTIAVLAGGVDNPYTDPAGNLWPRIVENGALISEEWLGSEITPEKFPKRNRLISGLSLGTLVVESDSRGGSLITAACALEQNREVFAVPGSVFSRPSKGTNALIGKSHAKLASSARDILEDILPGRSNCPACEAATAASLAGSATPEEQRILDCLEDEPLHIDLIAEKTGISPPVLLVSLFELELKHLVEQQPGHLFGRPA
ncbi:DNA-processing protein DprA [Prosthecochloris sp. GSB1]|uniref:DNA-processing protein DprA n=1 Tax=Prosthecochloris sp. GSB1 TaxID=281093 RepID=UPI001EED8A7C|nr:DNA-processing protein DprA [Prosthecochloris sp. GSB1]